MPANAVKAEVVSRPDVASSDLSAGRVGVRVSRLGLLLESLGVVAKGEMAGLVLALSCIAGNINDFVKA